MERCWIHCNICFNIPSATKNYTFLLTSCGHLICSKCIKDDITSTRPPTCRVCNKQSTYLEINRNLKPDIRCYFRSIKDVTVECMQNLKLVIEFQTYHRSRLLKYQQEKCRKAIKYARGAQAEITRHNEMESSILAEQNKLKHELEKVKKNSNYLEKLVADRDRELHKLRERHSRSHSPQKRTPKRLYPSLNGTTPINTLSFLDCATSTPIITDIFGYTANANVHTSSSGYGSSGNLKSMFDTPTAFEQQVISGNAFFNVESTGKSWSGFGFTSPMAPFM